MKAFKEFVMFTMFSCTFALIVWFISFPLAFEVLSTFSLMYSMGLLPPLLLEGDLKRIPMVESLHSNPCLRKRSPHDLASLKLVLKLFLFLSQREGNHLYPQAFVRLNSP
jgi:hypothetical protein